jgi:hypothetical protein
MYFYDDESIYYNIYMNDDTPDAYTLLLFYDDYPEDNPEDNPHAPKNYTRAWLEHV